MIPSVEITQLDGALGVIPPTNGDVMAIVGPATAGPKNRPAAYARDREVIGAHGGGELVEAAAYALERAGRPVVLVRAEASTAGSYGSPDLSAWGGTATPSLDSGVEPVDGYELVVTITRGGTVGTTGIRYTVSLDGGRTTSPEASLGVLTEIAVPGAATIELTAGTVTAGAVFAVRCTGPQMSGADLSAALEALAQSALPWDFVYVLGTATASTATTIGAWLETRGRAGRAAFALANCRLPTAGESEADYRAAMAAAFAETYVPGLAVGFGACRVESSVSRRRYLRPAIWPVATRAALVSDEVDLAQVDKGPLPGVTIRDSNGNPEHHDETINPGADDARFVTLRTFDGRPGVYVTNPRTMAEPGSDYLFLQYVRIVNKACRALRRYFDSRLSRAIRLDRKTGYILEDEAREIENGANAAVRVAVGGKVSDHAFVLSRTDNVISTMTLTGEERLVPFGYPKRIAVSVGFNNPALRASRV